MFMMMSSWKRHCESSSHKYRTVPSDCCDTETKPANSYCRSAYRLLFSTVDTLLWMIK